MRKILALAVIISILFVGITLAISWYKTNQATIGWDAVTHLDDPDGGTIPVPTGDVIKYNVYIMDAKSGVSSVVASDIDVTTYTHTFTSEGFFYFGIESLRYVLIDGSLASDPIPSNEIAWSSDPIYCINNTAFGVRYHFPPGQTNNIAKQ